MNIPLPLHTPLPPLWVGLTGFLSFAALSALIKLLRLDLDPFSLTAPWIGLNALLTGTWLWLKEGPAAFRTEIPGVHLLRGVLLCIPFLAGVYAVRYLPLSLYSTLVNTAPFFLVLLAGWWLRESIGGREWGAVAVGFVGVVICLRPGWDEFSWFLLAPLGSALSIAWGNAMIRRYPSEPALRWVFYQETVGAVIAGVLLMVTESRLPDWEHTPALLSMVSIDLLAMISSFYAFRRLEAAKLAPWIYIQIPAAGFAGWLLFAEIPSWTTAVGALLVIAGGWLTLQQRPG